MGLSATKISEQSHVVDLSAGDDSAEKETTPLFLRPGYNAFYKNKMSEVIELALNRRGKALIRGFFGVRDGEYLSPFSAPFGGFWPLKQTVSLADYMELGTSLHDFLNTNHSKSCQLTLPPACYEPSQISMQIKGLLAAGFAIAHVDINHNIELGTGEFETGLHRGGRRSLKNAMSHGLTFIQCESPEDCRRAYNVIKTNRQQKGKPLHLGFEDIESVMQLTDIDFFLIKQGEVDVAGAVVYRVTADIMQVIYWGHDVNYNALNPVHLLARHLFEFYRADYTILDIGTSSIAGVPDPGLCSFKESIGCKTSLKYTLVHPIPSGNKP